VSVQARGPVVEVAIDVVAVLPVAVVREIATPALEAVQAARVGVPNTISRAPFDPQLLTDPNLRHLELGRHFGTSVTDHQLCARAAVQIHEVGASIQNADRSVRGQDRRVLVTELSLDHDQLELAAPQFDDRDPVRGIG
jgi:hypothetical protein